MLLPLVGVGQNGGVFDCSSLPSNFIYHTYNGWESAWLDTINPHQNPDNFSSDSTGLWQFGHSYKTEFDSVSTFNGWVTDSIDNYGVGEKSWFQVESNQWGHSMFILFEHNYSTDSLLDGGYVQYNMNGNWHNLDNSWAAADAWEPGMRFHNYVGLPDDTLGMLHDSIPAFTGQSNGWIWSGFEMFIGGPVFQGDENRGQNNTGSAFQVRFVFESDSIQGSTDGWMIRNVVIGTVYLGSSILETNYQPLTIYPNPTTSHINIQLPENNLNATRTRIYDMTGRLVHQQPYNPNMDVGYLDSGTYIVVVETEEGNFRGTVQKQ